MQVIARQSGLGRQPRIAVVGGDGRSSRVRWPAGYEVAVFPTTGERSMVPSAVLSGAQAGRWDVVVMLTRFNAGGAISAVRAAARGGARVVAWPRGVSALAAELEAATGFAPWLPQPLEEIGRVEIVPVRCYSADAQVFDLASAAAMEAVAEMKAAAPAPTSDPPPAPKAPEILGSINALVGRASSAPASEPRSVAQIAAAYAAAVERRNHFRGERDQAAAMLADAQADYDRAETELQAAKAALLEAGE